MIDWYTALFRMHVKDPNCKQILFGASGSLKYVNVLKEQHMFAEKMTIIQRDTGDTSLMHLGLKGVVFVRIFDSLGANGTAKSTSDGIPKANSIVRICQSDKQIVNVSIRKNHSVRTP